MRPLVEFNCLTLVVGDVILAEARYVHADAFVDGWCWCWFWCDVFVDVDVDVSLLFINNSPPKLQLGNQPWTAENVDFDVDVELMMLLLVFAFDHNIQPIYTLLTS